MGEHDSEFHPSGQVEIARLRGAGGRADGLPFSGRDPKAKVGALEKFPE